MRREVRHIPLISGIFCAHIEILTKIGYRFFGRKTKKLNHSGKLICFVKGTRKKLAMKRENMIWKVLVVHDRKYHLFLAPGAGRGKVGGERKRVQAPQKNDRNDFFIFPGHPGVARKLLPLTLESFWSGPRAPRIEGSVSAPLPAGKGGPGTFGSIWCCRCCR